MYLKFLGSHSNTSTLVYMAIPGELTKPGNTLVYAELNMSLRSWNYMVTNPLQVNAYRITGDWETSNVAEDNPKYGSSFPATDSTILDYSLITSSATRGDIVPFDITKAARLWQDGTANYGIMLSAPTTSSNNDFVTFYSSEYSTADTYDPKFTFVYRHMSGLEDYWSNA